MKKIEAYQTSDGEKFFEKSEAKSHEEWIKYRANMEKVEDYLSNLLNMKNPDNKDQFSELLSECKSFLNSMELDEVVEMLFDMVTVSDGALLKAAKYVERIMSK